MHVCACIVAFHIQCMYKHIVSSSFDVVSLWGLEFLQNVPIQWGEPCYDVSIHTCTCACMYTISQKIHVDVEAYHDTYMLVNEYMYKLCYHIRYLYNVHACDAFIRMSVASVVPGCFPCDSHVTCTPYQIFSLPFSHRFPLSGAHSRWSTLWTAKPSRCCLPCDNDHTQHQSPSFSLDLSRNDPSWRTTPIWLALLVRGARRASHWRGGGWWGSGLSGKAQDAEDTRERESKESITRTCTPYIDLKVLQTGLLL